MLSSRDTLRGVAGVVDVAFTDAEGGVAGGTDREAGAASSLSWIAAELAVTSVVTARQVHGRVVHVVDQSAMAGPEQGLVGDGLVSASPDVALGVWVADCVPVVLSDADNGVIAVAHAGRAGVVAGVVPATVEAMLRLGARQPVAWIGPHICGGCYEVPESMRSEVADVVPTAFACTTWGTPALDLGAAVTAQLEQLGCPVMARSRCTRESADLPSYRRDGTAAGRLAAVVVRHAASEGGGLD